ncbi:MAG: TorF family putative porin [Elusimicrobiota bacterium]
MKTLTLVAAVCLLSILSSKSRAAEETPSGLACSSELDIVSKYVWRGIPQSPAANEAYQPSVTVSKYGFTANAWLNYSVDMPQRDKFSEFDLTLSYERKLNDLSVSPGFALYTFPDLDSYGEAYMKLSHPIGFFKVMTDHYFSMLRSDIAGGYYGDAGLGYEKPLAGDSLWTSSALLGWGNSAFNSVNYNTPGPANRFNVLVLDTAVSFKLGDNGLVRPHLTYYATLPGRLRGGIREAGNAPNSLVIGIAVDYNFL